MKESPANRALTATEASVLELIGQGKSSKEIAGALNMSVLTVGNHRKSIARKLNLHSTAELASYGAMTGVTSPQADCSLNLRLTLDNVVVDISYTGQLKSKGGNAKVSIGKSTFQF